MGRRALRLALANRGAEGRHPQSDLTTAELVSDAYPGADLDADRLNAARAAASRTLARLARRGLAVRSRFPWVGIALTNAGLQQARQLPPPVPVPDDDGPPDDW